MPAAPELDGIAGKVREVEVLHQLEAERLRGAARRVRITREIAIDLEGEEHRRREQGRARIGRRIRVDGVHVRSEVVGDHDLLEQAPDDQLQAAFELAARKRSFALELRQQMRRALDRTRHELREKCHVERVVERIALGRDLAAIDIDDIAQALERVEGNAHRQHDLQRAHVRLEADRVEQVDGFGDEEPVVLEEAEESQVHRHTCNQQHAPALHVRRRGEEPADPEVDERAGYQQQQEFPAPRAVEDVARGEQQHVLRLATSDRPIQAEDDEQEDDECR